MVENKLICKNCREHILKCGYRYYHEKGSKWFCSTNHAEPLEITLK